MAGREGWRRRTAGQEGAKLAGITGLAADDGRHKE